MVDPKLIQQAKNRLRDRSPNSFSAEPSEQELLDEISSIQEENQNSQVIDNEGLDNRIETGMQRRALFGDQISPELKEYAYNIFPSLNEIAPKTDVQAPLALDQQMQQEEPQIQQERQPASIQTEKPQSAIQKEPQPETQEIAPQITPQIPQQEKVSDIEKMIQEARKKEDTAEYFKDLAKLRDAAMGVGSGRVITGDYSTYEEMKKRAKRPMEEMLLKQELEDRTAKNDPNSSVSKLMRKTLQDTGVSMEGFDNVSYAQLEKIYPSLANTISAKIAADARKEENALRRSERAEAKLEKLDQNKQKDLIKHIDYSINNLKKSYEQYSKSQTTIDSISNILGAAKNKITPGTSDVTLLYSFISSLDPASTVREGEIALSKSAMSLWGRIKQGSAQLTGGDLLDSATRKSIEEIMRSVQSAREKQFAKQKANMIQSGVGKGLDKDMLNAYIYPEIDASSALSTSKKEEVSIEDKLKQFEERLNKNQTRIQELKKKREM